LNVSISTVSRALNGSYGVHKRTREQVLQLAKELGYVPDANAKSLVNKKSGLVGVIIPEYDHEVRPEFFELLPHLNKTLKLHGKNTIILSFPPRSYQANDLDRLMKQRNLEGCIILPGFLESHPILRDAKKLNLPVVVLEEETIGRYCSNIGTDEVEGAYKAVTYLIENGHKRIGFVNGPYDYVHICKERFLGYKKAMEEAGLYFDQRFIVNSDFTGAGGAKSIQQLLKQNPSITAVFFANDLMAMGAISYLCAQGYKIPEDLSIVGYDGLFMTEYYNPPLTTIQNNNQRIGIQAAELLIELINGGAGRRVRVSPVLLERKTVKRLAMEYP
jgi:LacI family transcriptional regulator